MKEKDFELATSASSFVGSDEQKSWKDWQKNHGTMLEHLEIMNKYLNFLKTLALFKAKGVPIKIWKGVGIKWADHLPEPLPVRTLVDQPMLTTNSLLEEHAAYIIAGVGICAGSEAYKMLMEYDIPMEWSEESISLEDQLNVNTQEELQSDSKA